MPAKCGSPAWWVAFDARRAAAAREEERRERRREKRKKERLEREWPSLLAALRWCPRCGCITTRSPRITRRRPRHELDLICSTCVENVWGAPYRPVGSRGPAGIFFQRCEQPHTLVQLLATDLRRMAEGSERRPLWAARGRVALTDRERVHAAHLARSVPSWDGWMYAAYAPEAKVIEMRRHFSPLRGERRGGETVLAIADGSSEKLS